MPMYVRIYLTGESSTGFFVEKPEFIDWKESNVQRKFTLRTDDNDGVCPGAPLYRTQLQLDNMSRQQT